MEHKDYIKKIFDLTGEVAIVTGGMGQLGAEYIEALAKAGASVASFDVSDKVNPKVVELQKSGFSISLHKLDITKSDEVRREIEKVSGSLGIPTILVNNAGLDSPPNSSARDNGPFEDYPEETWDAVIDSHLKGMFFMSQEFIRAIRGTEKKGSIINISSTYGVVSPDQSMYEFRRKNGEEFFKPVAYSVAKSGVLNFTRWLAEYCRERDVSVRVNTLVPGGVFRNQSEEFLKEYNKRTILGRMAEENEYNAAIIFLAADKASSYMTGSMLIIDGGLTAR